jgi:hypothetical protein
LSIEEGKAGQLLIPEGMDTYIAYARKLVKEREYFGAFARIHVLVEVWLQNLYEDNYQTSHTDAELAQLIREIGPQSRYRYTRLVEGLAKDEILSPEEAKRLRNFNDLRNNILHRLLKYAFFTYPWHVVMKEEAENGFEEGVKLAKLLEAKCGGRWVMLGENNKLYFLSGRPNKGKFVRPEADAK